VFGVVRYASLAGNRHARHRLWAASAALLAHFWLLLPTEAAMGDRQLIRAMIPHHSAAIQMCKESSLSDSQVKKSCEEVVSSQEREIAQMKGPLADGK